MDANLIEKLLIVLVCLSLVSIFGLAAYLGFLFHDFDDMDEPPGSEDEIICDHVDNGMFYLTHPPKYCCKKCGEFYL